MTIETITEVTPELLEGLAHLIPQLSSSAPAPSAAALAEMIESPGTTLFVARLETASSPIVGSLTLVVYRIPTGLHAVIEDVVVDTETRGAGCGGALVAAALERARALGVKNVDLTSRPSRVAANRLYVRMGFEERETNVYRYSRK